MSFSGRLNHRASIRRPPATEDRFGDLQVASVAPLYTDVPCYYYTPRAPDVRDIGVGNQTVGHKKFFFEPTADILFNDIIELTFGPNKGKSFKVVSADKILNHHWEVAVDEYYGPK